MGADYDGITTRGNTKEKKKKQDGSFGCLWDGGIDTLTHAAAEQRGKDQREGGSPPSSHPPSCRLLSVRPLICCRRIKRTPRLLLLFYKGQIATFLLDLCH